jgi:hypothetical protein
VPRASYAQPPALPLTLTDQDLEKVQNELHARHPLSEPPRTAYGEPSETGYGPYAGETRECRRAARAGASESDNCKRNRIGGQS